MCNLSRMSDREELYATILGIRPPWHVTQVEMWAKQGEVTVTIAERSDARHHRQRLGIMSIMGIYGH